MGNFSIFLRMLCLLPIALVWITLDQPWDDRPGPVDALKNTVLNWRYLYRGPVEATDVANDEPLRLAYVNVDEYTVSSLGERPWNRKVYADVATALIQLGQASVVGYDFVLSSLVATDMVPQKNINDSNERMMRTMEKFSDQIVLASAYTGVLDKKYMLTAANFPHLYDIYEDFDNPKTNPYPEMPSAPIIAQEYGNVGLINPDMNRTWGAIARQVPVFAEVEGEQHSRNLMEGWSGYYSETSPLKKDFDGDEFKLIKENGEVFKTFPKKTKVRFLTMGLKMLLLHHGLDESAVTIEKDAVLVRGKSGELLYDIPLLYGQNIDFNWFSPWRIWNKKNSFYEVQDSHESAQVILDYWRIFLAACNVPFDREKRYDLDAVAYVFDRVTTIAGAETRQELDMFLGVSREIKDQAAWEAFKQNPDTQIFFQIMPDLKEISSGTEASDYIFLNVFSMALQMVQDNSVWEAFIHDEGNKTLLTEDRYRQVFEIGEPAAIATTLFSTMKSNYENALVLVGPTDPILQDIAPTPFDSRPVPKVGVHGNVLKTIASASYIKRLNWHWDVVFVIVFSLLAGIAGLYHEKYYKLIAAVSGLSIIAYVVYAFYIFSSDHMVLPLVTPVGAALSTGLVGLIWRVVHEEKQKGRIKGMFGTYLSPELVHTMVESGEEPQLGGEDTEITAFFSDVQGFSGFSEQLSPQGLVELMNEYLTAMTSILLDHGCYVDKYIGDAIVGIFNAPLEVQDHAMKGCIASMHQHKKLDELRAKWLSEGDKWPPIVSVMQARLGMNTGHATVGNMGSEDRFNYTMMGDTVNLAARCESGAKAYGVYSMVTGETKESACASGDDCVFRYLDKIVVKGRSAPAEMFEIVCLKEDMNPEIEQCLETYNKAMDIYLNQEWDKAYELFEAASKLEPNRPELNDQAPTTPSVVMMERSLAMKENPPGADWDGVYIMTTK